MYLIFGGKTYYPNGGANDILGTSNSLQEAELKAENLIGQTAVFVKAEDGDEEYDQSEEIEWTQVFDCQTSNIIKTFGEMRFFERPAIEIR